MKIEFKKVMPHPLKEYPHSEESVWNNSFVLNPHKKVMLNASSGKGKTTFMGILYGTRKDYDGDVSLNGENIKTFDLKKWTNLRKDKVSSIFQDLQLFPELSVKENLQLKNRLTDHKSESDIDAMLDHLGILDKKEKKCGILSMGQQQRVAIIRSLLQPFEWLFMDEPFSHLDEDNTQKGLELIVNECNLQKSGFILTSLGSSHDFDFDQELKI